MNGVLLRQIALLLPSCCFLRVAPEIAVVPDFDFEKFSGGWYPVAMITDQGKVKVYGTHIVTYESESPGKLFMSLDYWHKGLCRKKSYRLHQTNQPGKYTLTNGDVLIIMETDYKTYHILFANQSNKRAMHLLSRQRGGSPKMKDTFKKLATLHGFSLDNIYYSYIQNPCYSR